MSLHPGDAHEWDFSAEDQTAAPRPQTSQTRGGRARGSAGDAPRESMLDLTDLPPEIASVTMAVAPWQWLLAASGCLLVSLVLCLVAEDRPWVSFTGWLFGGLFSVGLVATFMVLDNRRRAGQYLVPAGVEWWRRGLLMGALVAVLIHSAAFAGYAARTWQLLG